MSPEPPPIDPAETLQSVLPRWMVVCIALICLAFILGFGIIWPILNPGMTLGGDAKCMLALGLSLALAILLFALFPFAARIDNFPILSYLLKGKEIITTLAGPLVLFFACITVVLAVLVWAPDAPPAGIVLRPPPQTDQGLYWDRLEIRTENGSGLEYYFLVAPGESGSGCKEEFKGVYVQFKSDAQGPFTVNLIDDAEDTQLASGSFDRRSGDQNLHKPDR